MAFVKDPTVFLADGVYWDAYTKDMYFLRYGLWIPISSMGSEEIYKIKKFMKDTFPKEYEKLIRDKIWDPI